MVERVFAWLDRAIARLCIVLLWASTSAMFLILVANTVLRYAQGKSVQWANEVPELLFPWLVVAGVVLAAQRGAHITTGFLVARLPQQVQRMVLSAGWLIVATLSGTLSVATMKMISIVHDEKSPILQVPGSVTYACVLVGLCLLTLLAAMEAWRVAFRSAPATIDDAPAAVHW